MRRGKPRNRRPRRIRASGGGWLRCSDWRDCPSPKATSDARRPPMPWKWRPARAGPGPVWFATEPDQEAAGDSLGASIEGLASGDDGLDRSGDDGLDRSGDVTGAVVGRVVVELAPGLLHPAIAPTRATASRILLNMTSTPRMCPGRGTPARPAVPALRPYGVRRKGPVGRWVTFWLQSSRRRCMPAPLSERAMRVIDRRSRRADQ